jgi:AraC-like DNA-binding protein
VFLKSNLPLAVIDQRETRVPLQSVFDLFDNSGRITGSRTFGLDVGLAMNHCNYGLWIEYCTSATTLRQAIQRSIDTYRFHQTGGGIRIDYEGPNAVWRYYAHEQLAPSIHHSDHLIGPMLSFVSVFLLPGEKPAWLELAYTKDTLAKEVEDRFHEPIRFGTGYTGISFSASILDRKRGKQNIKRHITYLDVAANEAEPTQAEPIQSIASILTLRMLDGLTDIDGTAETAGMGVQTLQRMLRQEGTSYRQLLDKIRSDKARALLIETPLNITEIGLTLGYSEHANFTRAFSRWQGCSPSRYRNQYTSV